MAQIPNTHCTEVGWNLIPGCGGSVLVLSAMKGKKKKIRSGKALCEGKEKQCRGRGQEAQTNIAW